MTDVASDDTLRMGKSTKLELMGFESATSGRTLTKV